MRVNAWVRKIPGGGHGNPLQDSCLEWVAMPFPRGLTPPRDQAQVSHVDRWIAYHGAAQEALPV